MSADSTGKGSNERWERLQQLFSQAVDLSGPDRKAFVEKETAGDAALRAELLELLACDNGGARTGPLTLALGAALDTTTRDRRKALVGRTLGNYKLVGVLGHGGTGTVYLGERADRQYSAQVAVKIVDNGTMQGELGLRFRAERQILASLNHANIARLIDAGETEEGNPYLVMEYVHGEPLDRYCDREQLGLRERLQLFLDICGAVQYAHQNLVVHRDLKPANILVTAEGAPKLLDFGIAKLLDAGEAAAAMALTRMNDRLLTPEYASPEQILGRPVTTASDVYALGVVLYELLTGLRPYVVPASASQLELERSICITDPLRPSAAVKRARESGPLEGQSEILAVAAARRLNADKLQKRLIGDIDAIVMRALRKEPQHRYNSIEQLAADVRRFLAREPVSARQGNWLYYSQRFVRRHAFGVSAGAAFILFLAAFAVVMSVQRQTIAEQRDFAEQEGERAERVSTFMLNVFNAADPLENLGRDITARELLDQAARSIQGDLDEQPESRARLLEAIGRAYHRQNNPERAIAYLEDALRIRQQGENSGSPAMGSTLTELATALRKAGRFDESDRRLREAMDISRSSKDEHSMAYARLLTDIGRLEIERGQPQQAEHDLGEALALARDLRGAGDTEVAAILSDISVARMWRDDLDGAERAVQEAVSIYEKSSNLLYPDRIMSDYRLAEVYFQRGRITEAGALYERALSAQKLLYGEPSSRVADTLDSLSRVRLAQNRVDEAERLTREALAAYKATRGPEHYGTAYLESSLAQILTRQGKYAEAGELLRSALDVFAKTLPSDHQYVASSEYLLGEVLLAQNHYSDAEALLLASRSRWERSGAPEWRAARSASALGEALYRQGRVAEAEKYLLEGYRGLNANSGADQATKSKARERIARFYTDRGERHKLDELSLAASQ
jgi:serine/threonine protein kinase/TolA-binding protein